jgi:TetR/AcrR family transcriptional regulator, transcriptional repressor for nem operon
MVLDRLARIDEHYEMSAEVSATTVADMFSSIIEGGIILARNFNNNELLAQQILAYRSFIKMIYGIR